MQRVVEDLVNEFGARTGYTESDEITLIWAPLEDDNPDKDFIFGGRICKIASLLAGFASARFNYYLNQEKFPEDKLKTKAERCMAYFDGRCFGVPSKQEGLNNIIWRCLFDCRRNGVAGLGHYRLGHKRCHNKGTTELKKLLEKEGHSYEDMPLT
eukprot:UN28961